MVDNSEVKIFGKLEQVVVGYLAVNAGVSVAFGSNIAVIAIGLIGVVLAIGALAYRYAIHHRHDMNG